MVFKKFSLLKRHTHSLCDKTLGCYFYLYTKERDILCQYTK